VTDHTPQTPRSPLGAESVSLAGAPGVPLIGSPNVPVGQLVQVGQLVYFHRHTAVTGRKRRPHGRTNGPRRWKVTTRVVEDPLIDKLREESA
jgi:hypothetical protein